MQLSPPWAANSSDWQKRNAEELRQTILFLFSQSWNWVLISLPILIPLFGGVGVSYVSDVLLEPGQCWPTKRMWLKCQLCEPRFQIQGQTQWFTIRKRVYLYGNYGHHKRANKYSCCKQKPSCLLWVQRVQVLDVLSASGKQSKTH